MSKKMHRPIKLSFIATLIFTTIFVIGASAAYAVEVSSGVTEIKIPLVLKSEAPIAGAEIAFKQSGGLEYVRFEAAGGAENPLMASSGGNTWVGFFSATNKYKAADGSLSFGNLVFRYTGASSESVTILETRLHSITGAEVSSVRSKPNTVIPVRRAEIGDAVKNEPIVVDTTPTDKVETENGAVNSKDKGAGNSAVSSAGQTKTTAATTSGDKVSSAQSKITTSANTGAALALANAPATGQTQSPSSPAAASAPNAEAPAMVPFSAPDSIADTATPLADNENAAKHAGQKGAPSPWLLVTLLAILVAGTGIFIIMRKRRLASKAANEAAAKDTYVSSR